MMMNFQKFRAESPWITGLLWLTSLVSYYALSNLEMGLQLFALLFLVCVVVTLAAIAATPFAVITLWRQRDRATRYVRVPDTVANADWKGMAKTGQAGSAKVGAAAASGLGRLSTRVGTRMGITLRWVREWPWTEIRRKTLWVMANVIVTFLPLVVFGVGLLAFILFDALRDLPKNYLLVPFTGAILGLDAAFHNRGYRPENTVWHATPLYLLARAFDADRQGHHVFRAGYRRSDPDRVLVYGKPLGPRVDCGHDTFRDCVHCRLQHDTRRDYLVDRRAGAPLAR